MAVMPVRAWPRLLAACTALLACASAEASACSSLEASATTFEGAGITRARTDGTAADGEALRLVAMADAVFYVAKVAHNDYPVAFRLTTCDAERLVFENPGHASHVGSSVGASTPTGWKCS